MQTFLPLPDFAATARVLDARRLGKQRVEALQVLRALTRPGYGWARHPAVRMWAGYEEGLVRYGMEICRHWRLAGRGDTCEVTMLTDLRHATGVRAPRPQEELARAGELPPWLGDPAFHLSHRSALVRKDPEHYVPLFPGTPDDLPYVWPGSDRDTGAPRAG
ncbi:MSMEG_6728 family protein [Streptomyces sp. TRM 70361]|uniref:MSMEG_6728 family protein n=1 Tax=Streptomyces sp. TRM 70361 TaxID=3116553 RepID=UPI002E7B561E|nr:MSMEG_6728 family protein [Streptomyces sp. TRM 70361]MEE1941228.1 MSMEG_6728 family protein [Streptomyces sp. TRM 70361]